MREATEQQYKLAHQKVKMRALSSFSDPDGIMPFGFGCPAMDTDWGIDTPLARCQIRKKDRHEKEWTITYYLDESFFDLETPKIDLAEIALIAESLRHREDEILPKGWKAMKIATALEALPKLVAALQNVNGHYNTPIGRRKANEGQLEALQSADYALTLFEATKTVQQ